MAPVFPSLAGQFHVRWGAVYTCPRLCSRAELLNFRAQWKASGHLRSGDSESTGVEWSGVEWHLRGYSSDNPSSHPDDNGQQIPC